MKLSMRRKVGRTCIAERADADDLFVAELKRAHQRDLVSRYVIETFEKVWMPGVKDCGQV